MLPLERGKKKNPRKNDHFKKKTINHSKAFRVITLNIW